MSYLGLQQLGTPRAATQVQNAMRDARMQKHRAPSASGGFANVDLNPRRPTTNRIAIRITNARNRYRTKGATRMPAESISLGTPISLPEGLRGTGDTAETLSAERGTVCFADTGFSVTYEPWSSRIFRSLTEYESE
jgi:hypothetical protein